MTIFLLHQEAIRRFTAACPPPIRVLLPQKKKILLLEKLELTLDYEDNQEGFAKAIRVIDLLSIASALTISAVRVLTIKATGFSDIRVDPVALANVYGIRSEAEGTRPPHH